MNVNQWVYDLETKIYSVVKSISESKLKKKYPDIFFTQEEESYEKPTFPSILIKRLQTAERNSDLERIAVVTVPFTAQVTVTSNKGRRDAYCVADTICDVYKSKGFLIKNMPNVRKEDKLWVATFRVSRNFDRNDIL